MVILLLSLLYFCSYFFIIIIIIPPLWIDTWMINLYELLLRGTDHICLYKYFDMVIITGRVQCVQCTRVHVAPQPKRLGAYRQSPLAPSSVATASLHPIHFLQWAPPSVCPLPPPAARTYRVAPHF